MSKIAVKIHLDGNPKGMKPLLLSDTLTSVRTKIMDKVNSSYIFLDGDGLEINRNDENDITLGDIVKDKIIKLKSIGGGQPGINIFLNESEVCSVNCQKSNNLNEVRNQIKDKIKDDFIFIDQDGQPITKTDEGDITVEDILINQSIKLKGTNSPAATPFNKSNEKKNTNKGGDKKLHMKKNKNIDFSKHEILEKTDTLITYRYSKMPKQSNHKLVYQYFYDVYDPEDYHNAYVILFCGKTGDGKTTAINALFNIIKGISLEDNYRFILIIEPSKKKGQAESQTDGVHLYYLKDYNNKPVIIIDSQGYGDTRGKEYDDMVDEAFRYVFSNVIDHINTAFFIVQSSTNRIDIQTKYIFSSVTSLFAEDISENFIILATFANKQTIKTGPAFVDSIKTDADFLNINQRMGTNWWYAIDSKSILENDRDTITIYSFEKANLLYEETIKKLRPKGIKKCAEVLNTRMELKVQVENLKDTFDILLIEQDNLQEKEKIINATNDKIRGLEDKINALENDKKELSPKEFEEKMKKLNEEINNNLISLNSQTESKQIKKLKYCESSKCTHCESCEKNCHETCDCSFSFLGRCKIFTFWEKKCEECGCNKDRHKQDYYYYSIETVTIAKKNDDEKEKELKKNEEKKKEILKEINQKNNAKNNLERQQNELKYNQDILKKKKEINENEKSKIQIKINDINKQILFIIIRLQSISQKINDIALNNNHIKNEDEYMDDLMEKMNKMNIKEKDKIEKIKKIKKTNQIFMEAVKMDRNELLKLDESQLAEKLKVIIPTNKKEK